MNLPEPLLTRYRLPQVALPIFDSDIANKKYVDTHSAHIEFAFKIKSANQVSASTTMKPDTDLFFTATANKVYYILVSLWMNSAATADSKIAFTVPAGATIEFADNVFPNAWTDSTDATVVQTLATNATNQFLQMKLRLVMDATAGDCQLKFAQSVASGGLTEMLAGSCLIAYEA